MRSADRHRQSARLLLCLAVTAIAFAGAAQTATREPHIGYLYPAGGKQGTVVQISAGGQFLRGASAVHVSGDGVTAKVARYVEPIRANQLQELARRLRELGTGRRTSLIEPQLSMVEQDEPAFTRKAEKTAQKGKPDPSSGNKGNPAGKQNSATQTNQKKTNAAAKNRDITLPDHPMLRYLETLTPQELQVVARDWMNRDKRQPNQQIAETVVIDVTIAPDATPGDREIRIATNTGLTNPMRFQIGTLPEVSEHEPNNPDWPDIQEVTLPVTLNGQIMPGDADRFRFQARTGQKLVIDAQARHLIPYLADAVPGWFQATLLLYDSKGTEVAYVDDYRFNPDPVLFFDIPRDDEYTLEIHDAIFRGREDFVYRVSVGEQPFITGMYPLGGRFGEVTNAWITGWNLPFDRVKLDTLPGPDTIRQAALRRGAWVSNPVAYEVDTLPEAYETEPNDANSPNLKSVTLPANINGYIAQPGDVDIFRFQGQAGDKLVAEIYARRLGSPMDSLLELYDNAGRLLALNDDHEDKEMGLLTHHADSYLTATLPGNGDYYLHVSDTQNHGGSVYGYRLRLGAPRPDFALRATPSSINIPPGRTATITVFALRKDGFDGAIRIVTADPSGNFQLGGAVIPAGRDRVRMTVTALVAPEQPTTLKLEGRARLGGLVVSRPVVPADDMMQAFAYRHLVPAKELLVAIQGPQRSGNPVQAARNMARRFQQRLRSERPGIQVEGGTVRLPAGGTAMVQVLIPQRNPDRQLQFELSDPPDGVTLEEVTSGTGVLALHLKADAQVSVGPPDNLIVEAFTEITPRQQNGKATTQRRRFSVGYLPAIPYQIVKR